MKRVWVFLVIVSFVMSCDTGHPDQQSNTSSQTIEVSGLAYYDTRPVSDAQVLFVLADDTDLFFSTTTDANGYFTLSLDRVGEYEIYIGRATEDGYFDKEYTIAIDSDASTYDVGEIELEFYSSSVADDDLNEEFATIQSPLKIGSDYYLTMEWGWKYVSGCIKTEAKRLAIHLNKGSKQIFDVHAAVYVKKSKLCFGVYESVSGWEKCTCSPTKDQVEKFIYEAGIAAGAAAGVMWAVAKTAAPLLLPLLAL